MIFVKSGYVKVGRQEPFIKVQAPALILVGAHTHCYWINPVPYTGAWIQFNASYMETEISSLFASPVIVEGEAAVEAGDKIKQLLKMTRPAEGDARGEFCFKLKQQAFLFDIAEKIFSVAEPLNPSFVLPDREFSSFLAYLEQHIAEKWTVERMAQHCCRSQASFYRDFRNKMGKSPLQYLIQKRMEIAGMWLLNGKSVAQAASIVGYTDVSYFDRLFFKHFRRTPLAYKRVAGAPSFISEATQTKEK